MFAFSLVSLHLFRKFPVSMATCEIGRSTLFGRFSLTCEVTLSKEYNLFCGVRSWVIGGESGMLPDNDVVVGVSWERGYAASTSFWFNEHQCQKFMEHFFRRSPAAAKHHPSVMCAQ